MFIVTSVAILLTMLMALTRALLNLPQPALENLPGPCVVVARDLNANGFSGGPFGLLRSSSESRSRSLSRRVLRAE